MVVDALRHAVVGEEGSVTWIEWHVLEDTEASDLAVLSAAMEAISSAFVTEVTREIQLQQADLEPGGAGPYPSNRDFCRLVFEDVGGGSVVVNFVAPEAIFLAGDVVDPSNAGVADFIASCLLYVVSNTGVSLAEYVGGTRWRLDE